MESASDYRERFAKFVQWLEKSMNLDVDPKEDFYSYSCGRNAEATYDETQGEYAPNANGGTLTAILRNELMMSPALSKMRSFYSTFKTNLPDILRDPLLIDICGGFPIFNDNWSSANFDWIKAAGILDAMGLESILTTEVQFLDDSPIYTVRSGSIYEAEFELAEQNLRKLQISEEKLSEIINDANEILEQLRTLDQLIEEVGRYNWETQRRTLAEIQNDPFDYIKYFENPAGFPIPSDAIFHLIYDAPNQLDMFLNIFETAAPRTVANYITFLILTKNEIDTDRIRTSITWTYFAPVILSEGFGRYWNELENENRQMISERFFDVFNKTNEVLQVDTQSIGDDYFHKTQDVMDFISTNFDRNEIEAEYSDLVIGDNFITNIINVTTYGPAKCFKKCCPYRQTDIYVYMYSQSLLACLISYQGHPVIRHFSALTKDMWTHVIYSIYHVDYIPDIVSLDKDIKLRYNTLMEEDEESYMDPCLLEQIFWSIETFRLMYEDYKWWLDRNEDKRKIQDEELARLNLNSKRAFFVSYFQQNSRLDEFNHSQLFLAVMNCDDFVEEFDYYSHRVHSCKKVEFSWSTPHL